jgi:hypothetical protein
MLNSAIVRILAPPLMNRARQVSGSEWLKPTSTSDSPPITDSNRVACSVPNLSPNHLTSSAPVTAPKPPAPSSKLSMIWF